MLKILLKDGYLEVLEIQIEGKKRMSGKEFINGYIDMALFSRMFNANEDMCL